MKLYLIGNGFDIYHGINSRYSNFCEFLNTHSDESLKLRVFLETYHNSPDLWSQFEKALGEFDKNKYINHYNRLCASVDNNSQSTQNSIDYELVEVRQNLIEFFRTWVLSLEADINSLPIPTDKTIDSNSLFLTFNYTETLQKLYRIDEQKILHIHVTDKKTATGEFAQYVVGHGKKEIIGNSLESDIERSVREYINDFRKRPEDIMQNNESKNFWEKLNKVTEIIVLGMSLGDVDIPYFNKIIENIDKNNVHWKISHHTQNDLTRIKNVFSMLQLTNVEYGTIDDFIKK